MKSKYEGKFKPGDNYKMLTVVDGRIIMNHEACIKVKCDCGNEKVVSVIYLIKGRVISCGCQMNKSGKDHPLWNGGEFISSTQFNRLKRGAEQRNLIFSIDKNYLDDLLKKQKFKCAITELPIDDKCMSVDRIDCSIGYVSGNVRWIHKDINVMKNSFSDEYFTYLCKSVAGIKVELVNRSRYRRSRYKIKLKDSCGNIKEFSTMIDVKKFIDDWNCKNNLNGPSRIGWNEISRFRDSKGWSIIEKIKV